MTRKQELIDILEGLNPGDLIPLINEMSVEYGDNEAYIHSIDELDDILDGFFPREIIEMTQDINLNDKYFKEEVGEYRSFNRLKKDDIDYGQLADYILEFENSQDIEEIQAFLDSIYEE
jgi:hypothetical protein